MSCVGCPTRVRDCRSVGTSEQLRVALRRVGRMLRILHWQSLERTPRRSAPTDASGTATRRGRACPVPLSTGRPQGSPLRVLRAGESGQHEPCSLVQHAVEGPGLRIRVIAPQRRRDRRVVRQRRPITVSVVDLNGLALRAGRSGGRGVQDRKRRAATGLSCLRGSARRRTPATARSSACPRRRRSGRP